MFGALIGIGASLLGGLFSRPKRPPPPPPPAPPPQVIKVVETKSEVDYSKMADNAKKAGFNPLTALRYGGAAGHQVSQVPFLTSNPKFTDWEAKRDHTQQMYQYQNAARQHWGNMISSIGGQIGGAITKYNPTAMKAAKQSQMLQHELLRSEISRNYATAKKYSLQPNQAIAPSREWLSPQGSPRSTGLPNDWQKGDVTVTNPWRGAKVSPDHADAEVFEQRYGEIITEVMGISNAVEDWFYNNPTYRPERILSKISGYLAPKRKPSRSGGGGW